LTERGVQVGFELRMVFQSGSQALASEFRSALAAMAVQDNEAAIVASSSEVFAHHKLSTRNNG